MRRLIRIVQRGVNYLHVFVLPTMHHANLHLSNSNPTLAVPLHTTVVVLPVAWSPMHHLFVRCCERYGRGVIVHVMIVFLVPMKRFLHAILYHGWDVEKSG